MTTMIGLVASGFGVAILPSVVLGVHHPEVAYLPLVPRLSLETRLIWHPETLARKPALQAFVGGRPDERRSTTARRG
jgi:DNA-binding transcriptional LysR family regulator